MNNQEGDQTANTLLSAWIKSAADFWGSTLQNWSKFSTASEGSSTGKKAAPRNPLKRCLIPGRHSHRSPGIRVPWKLFPIWAGPCRNFCHKWSRPAGKAIFISSSSGWKRPVESVNHPRPLTLTILMKICLQSLDGHIRDRVPSVFPYPPARSHPGLSGKIQRDFGLPQLLSVRHWQRSRV